MAVENPTEVSFYNAPYLPDVENVDRIKLQQEIRIASTCGRAVTLYGQAGAGKTHIAVHLAYDFCTRTRAAQENPFVLWIEAKSAHSILTSFHTIALQLGLPVIDEPQSQVCQLVADWLREQIPNITRATAESSASRRRTRTTPPFSGRPYLIVLDGLESLDLLNKPLRLEPKFSKYSRSTHKFKALRRYLFLDDRHEPNLFITTRSQSVINHFDAENVAVGDLTVEEAQSMCDNIMAQYMTHFDASQIGVVLADRLSTNALIVQLVAGFIEFTNIKIPDYISLIYRRREKLSQSDPPVEFPLEFREHPGDPRTPNNLIAIIAELWKMILFNYNDSLEKQIPYPFDALMIVLGLGGHHVPVWDIWASPECTQIADEGSGTEQFMKLRLAKRYRPGILTMSNVLSKGLWIQTDSEGLSGPIMRDGANRIRCLLLMQTESGRGRGAECLPMTELALSYYPELRPDMLIDLLLDRSDYYLPLQFYTEAGRDASSAYAYSLEVYGDDSNSEIVLTSLHKLAQVTHNIGNYEMAEQMHRLALAGIENLPDSPGFKLNSATDLAMTLSRRGKHQESADLYRKVISSRKQPQDDDTEIQKHLSNLGTELCHLGQADEGLELQERAYENLVRLSGEDTKAAQEVLSDIIRTLTTQQRWTEAIGKSRRLLALREASIGPHGFGTLAAIAQLAHIVYEIGNKEESYKLYRRAIDGFTDRVGPMHHMTQGVQQNFNILFRERLVTV